MKAMDALDNFKSFAEKRGKEVSQLKPGEAVDLIIDFYKEIRADECDLDGQSDMLLFQWGVYNWGDGEYFEYSIIRQFILPAIAEENNIRGEDSIWHLSLTFRFLPSETMKELKAGNKWCSSIKELYQFKQYNDSVIEKSPSDISSATTDDNATACTFIRPVSVIGWFTRQLYVPVFSRSDATVVMTEVKLSVEY